MGWAWRFARISGINIKVHVTFLLALVWGALALGQDGPSGWLYGIFLTIVLFASVLFHELGHALVAQRYGIEVHDIVLLPIGGVARLNEMPRKPAQELVVALAGPAVNLILALLLAPIAVPVLLGRGATGDVFAMSALTRPGLLNLAVFFLAINVSLLVFNLIPAFPMDGGRVLRALLAFKLSFRLATRIAVFIGRIFAVLFVTVGMLTSNFSLAFVGLFVFFGGGAEGQDVEIRERLRGLTVTQAVDRRAPVLPADLPAHMAYDRLMRLPYAALAVIDDAGRLIGVATRREMQRQWVQGTRGPVSLFVEQPALALECATPLDVARQRMAAAHTQLVAVYCGNSFLGLLDFEGIARALAVQQLGWAGQSRIPGVREA